MALQSATFLRGKMGNVVFVERYGNYYARSQPLVVRQTVPTKIRSSNFATASNFCKHLRPLLRPMLPFAETKLMQGRLSGAFTKWFKLADTSNLLPVASIPFVDGFNYNPLTSIAERWKIDPTITITNAQELTVNIPAFVPTDSISAPANTIEAVFTIVVAGCMLSDTSKQTSDVKNILIPYSNTPVAAQVLRFVVAALPGTVIVTGIAIIYRLANGQLNENKAFMPVSIIDARYC